MGQSGSFWVIASYILGSLPFGYIITRLTAHQNILNIGWRKTSGSNVFKNIGKWQGVLTGLLDVAKGFAAVKLAQILDFPISIQVLSGVAAVVGHNWSCFLRLAGGRGIGAFVGAALAFSPRITGLTLIIPVIMALSWNASEATVLMLVLFLLLSLHFQKLNSLGILTSLSLAPIFAKRLSPVSELIEFRKDKGKNQIKWDLVKNRLVFDDDKPYAQPRIEKVIRYLTKK